MTATSKHISNRGESRNSWQL